MLTWVEIERAEEYNDRELGEIGGGLKTLLGFTFNQSRCGEGNALLPPPHPPTEPRPRLSVIDAGSNEFCVPPNVQIWNALHQHISMFGKNNGGFAETNV